MQAATHIHIKGAREHNLKNLEVRLPGKAGGHHRTQRLREMSLAFDTLMGGLPQIHGEPFDAGAPVLDH